MKTLDELTEMALHHAKTCLVGQPGAQMTPCWLIQGDKRTSIVATPFDGDRSKDFVAFVIRRLLKEENASAYSYVSEAWMAIEDLKYPIGLAPRERNDRREVVIITVADRKTSRMRSWEIIRGPDGTVIELKVNPIHGEEHFAGRFFNLFEDSHED